MDDKIKLAAEAVIAEHLKLSDEVLEEIRIRSERHSYSARLDAHHAVRNILGFVSLVCTKTDLLVLSGTDITDTTGRVTLPIQSLLCGAATEGLEEFGGSTTFVLVREPNFVATPRGSTPTFLTAVPHSTTQEMLDSSVLSDRAGNSIGDRKFLDNVSVEVMAWRNDGSPAGRTRFAWVCTVEAARRIFFG